MKIQKIYNKLSADYWLTSLIISGIVFSIYLFFTTKVKTFPFYFYNLLISVTLSVLIGYEYSLINYFFSNVYQTFGKLNPLFQSRQYQIFSQNLEKKLQRSWLYYLTTVVVLAPFVILELYGVLKYKFFNGPTPPYFYLFEPGHTLWSLVFDIINVTVKYSTLFLLAVIIWIMIELVLIINELREKYSIGLNVFFDEGEGLKPLRSFILSIVSSYFIIITLAMISYIPPTASILIRISPNAIITYEIIIFSLMLPVGVILFITTQQTIRNLTDKSVKSELDEIKRKYKETYDRTIEIISNIKNTDNEKELNELKTILDILEIEERKIKEINLNRSDTKTIVTFITSILLPIITLIQKLPINAIIEKITGLIGFKP